MGKQKVPGHGKTTSCRSCKGSQHTSKLVLMQIELQEVSHVVPLAGQATCTNEAWKLS